MKVSLNTIRQFIAFDLPPVNELVARINQQLGQVEEVIDLADKYKDVWVVRVEGVEKHPDADRLSVCLIDDSGVVKDVERDSQGYIQVVCGASNVQTGMYAAWLPPKATVPASYNDAEPFVLDTREIRGVKSNGMLAAADELALGSDHGGIIEIRSDEVLPSGVTIAPGVSFAKAYGLDDTIIDIENKMFTHRPDCFGQLGVAREIAGILGHTFTSPDWYVNAPDFVEAHQLELNVFNDAGAKSPRFMAVAVKNVTVKPSPLWLQIELVRLGGKPINNIVDATNYVMLLTGQPTHAYDYDKLNGQTLGVRMARSGETCSLLNGKTYKLTEEDIVIVDGAGVVGLGGVMGGGSSEVGETTKNVVLEVANFDMYAIRKTSMRHGLFTDAVTRFNKGQPPQQAPVVTQFLMDNLKRLAGGEQASTVADLGLGVNARFLDNDIHIDTPQDITEKFINERLGLALSSGEITSLLEAVEFRVNMSEDKASLKVYAPFWRTDIQLPEDIVEEVGRLYGFDKLPRELPKRSIAPATENPTLVMKRHVRITLKAAGANEVVTYSFVHENLLKHAEQDPTQAFSLSNALSPDLQQYRLSVVPSLLAHVHANSKAGHGDFALFEFGKAHRKGDMDDEGLPREYQRLGFVYAAKKGEGAAYYTARRYAELLVPGLTFCPLKQFDAGDYPVFEQLIAPFSPERSAVLMNGEKFYGVVGEFKPSVVRSFKLPTHAAGFEMFQSCLLGAVTKSYIPLSKYPSVTQDISLKVTNDTPYDALFRVVEAELRQRTPLNVVATLTPLSVYQAADDAAHKTITLRLEVVSYDKTLTDKEVSSVIDALAQAASKDLHAEHI